MAAQEANRAPPTAVDTGAPFGRDWETRAALMAAQEAGRAPPTVVEAKAPPG
jgi:hypothetical protein